MVADGGCAKVDDGAGPRPESRVLGNCFWVLVSTSTSVAPLKPRTDGSEEGRRRERKGRVGADANQEVNNGRRRWLRWRRRRHGVTDVVVDVDADSEAPPLSLQHQVHRT